MLKRAAATLLLGVVGALVAAIGAGAHRSTGYLGLVLAIALVACAGTFAKAWQAWGGFIAFASTWVVVTFFFSVEGPGQSKLLEGDLKDKLWIFGAASVLAVIAAIPPFALEGRDVSS